MLTVPNILWLRNQV